MIALVYYSHEGNTDFIAKKIAEKTNIELIQLIPRKDYPTGKVSKYVWGGKSVVFGEKPALINGKLDLRRYETIVIGTPIWASKFAPPINTFLHTNYIKGKNIYLFACHIGGGAEKCFQKMAGILSDNVLLGTMDFIDPLNRLQENIDSKVDEIVSKITGRKE